MSETERLLSTGDVAQIFRVDSNTVARWAARGLVPAVRTPGGHYRFRRKDLAPYLEAEASQNTPS